MSEYQLYLTIAVVSTVVFVIKMSMMFLGGDDGGMDADGGFESDVSDLDAQSIFMDFSIQAILAFLMGFGWMGLAARFEFELGRLESIVTAAGFGVAMFYFAAYLTRQLRNLNRPASLKMQNAAGLTGSVYVTVPASGKGEGRVKVSIDGRERTLRAVNTTNSQINSFTQVKVDRVEGEVLYVTPE